MQAIIGEKYREKKKGCRFYYRKCDTYILDLIYEPPK
jgi:hypothetical protein